MACRVDTTATSISSGASASADWQPAIHDVLPWCPITPNAHRGLFRALIRVSQLKPFLLVCMLSRRHDNHRFRAYLESPRSPVRPAAPSNPQGDSDGLAGPVRSLDEDPHESGAVLRYSVPLSFYPAGMHGFLLESPHSCILARMPASMPSGMQARMQTCMPVSKKESHRAVLWSLIRSEGAACRSSWSIPKPGECQRPQRQ